MNKVFIVTERKPMYDIILRVFTKYQDAIAYGEGLVFDGTIAEYDVCEREVY